MSKRSSKSKESRSMNDVVFDIVQSFTSEGQASEKDPHKRPQRQVPAKN
jgi:hypothetical protein